MIELFIEKYHREDEIYDKDRHERNYDASRRAFPHTLRPTYGSCSPTARNDGDDGTKRDRFRRHYTNIAQLEILRSRINHDVWRDAVAEIGEDDRCCHGLRKTNQR